jgi:hypothetical protein
MTEKAIRDAASMAAGRIATRLFLDHYIKKPNDRKMLKIMRDNIADSIRLNAKWE